MRFRSVLIGAAVLAALGAVAHHQHTQPTPASTSGPGEQLVVEDLLSSRHVSSGGQATLDSWVTCVRPDQLTRPYSQRDRAREVQVPADYAYRQGQPCPDGPPPTR